MADLWRIFLIFERINAIIGMKIAKIYHKGTGSNHAPIPLRKGENKPGKTD